MEDENAFNMNARDWSDFPWQVVLGCLPTPSELIDHELRNEFNREIYWDSEGNLWDQDRSEPEIGPTELNADHIVRAYHDLFNGANNFWDPENVFEQALDDQGVPESPKKVVEKNLNLYEGVKNYRDLINNSHSLEDTVSYDFLLSPVEDREYVSIEEDNLDVLKNEEKEVGVGESVFFFINTVDKNFQEYVKDEVQNPELNIEAYIEDESLKLDIYDNGPGIDDEEKEGLLDPDCVGNTGLPTANYIIEQYNGSLEYCDSESGFGLRAEFELR